MGNRINGPTCDMLGRRKFPSGEAWLAASRFGGSYTSRVPNSPEGVIALTTAEKHHGDLKTWVLCGSFLRAGRNNRVAL